MPNFNGMWTSRQQMQASGAGIWPAFPGAPTSVSATAGTALATVTFTAPANTGYPAGITSYTVTSSPGGITATGASSPITVTGLTNGTAYTFTVTATNATGTGPASAASNSVTPQALTVSDVFSTNLWTGNASTQAISNGLDLSGEGGLVWIKSRTSTKDHRWLDSTRALDLSLRSNATGGVDDIGNPMSFGSAGYTLSSSTDINGTATNWVGWSFRNSEKFFRVVNYTGDGTSSNPISHGLGSTPGFVVVKRTDATGGDWWAYTTNPASPGSYFINKLNSTAIADGPNGGLNINSSTFNAADMSYQSAGDYTTLNASGAPYVAYVLADDAGGFGPSGTDSIIKVNRYSGNGGTLNVSLGWRPQWLMIKCTSQLSSWTVWDAQRDLASVPAYYLVPNDVNAEASQDWVVSTSTGFTLTGSDQRTNGSGFTYIYIAIREA